MGLDFDQLYPKRFIKAGQFGGKDLTMRITGVEVEKLGEETKQKVKAILSFARTDKQMVLNKTNGECVRAMFGRDTSNWVGKLVTFYPCPMKDPFTGEDIVAIRVRGSPEIEATKQFQARLGQKIKTLTVYKTKVGQPTAIEQPATVLAEPEPLLTDEPVDDASSALPFDDGGGAGSP